MRRSPLSSRITPGPIPAIGADEGRRIRRPITFHEVDRKFVPIILIRPHLIPTDTAYDKTMVRHPAEGPKVPLRAKLCRREKVLKLLGKHTGQAIGSPI